MLLLLSIVDRTAEAISRINLRREMLSDSLTGFAIARALRKRSRAAIEALEKIGLVWATGYAIILDGSGAVQPGQ